MCVLFLGCPKRSACRLRAPNMVRLFWFDLVWLLTIRNSEQPSVCLSVCLSYLSVCLPLCLYLSVCLSVCLCLSGSVCLSATVFLNLIQLHRTGCRTEDVQKVLSTLHHRFSAQSSVLTQPGFSFCVMRIQKRFSHRQGGVRIFDARASNLT